MTTDVDVFVVDDDEDLRTLLRCLFEEEGLRVACAADGQQAVEALCSGAVTARCVVLDVMMPGLDGFEVLDVIRARDRTWDTPVVMLTCRSQAGPMVNGLELGAHEYLAKPFDPDRLTVIVQNVLQASRVALRQHRLARLHAARTLAAASC